MKWWGCFGVLGFALACQATFPIRVCDAAALGFFWMLWWSAWRK